MGKKWDLRGFERGMVVAASVTPLVRVFFYIYNDHMRTVLLSTFTLVFTVTGENLEKTWRAQNRQ